MEVGMNIYRVLAVALTLTSIAAAEPLWAFQNGSGAALTLQVQEADAAGRLVFERMRVGVGFMASSAHDYTTANRIYKNGEAPAIAPDDVAFDATLAENITGTNIAKAVLRLEDSSGFYAPQLGFKAEVRKGSAAWTAGQASVQGVFEDEIWFEGLAPGEVRDVTLGFRVHGTNDLGPDVLKSAFIFTSLTNQRTGASTQGGIDWVRGSGALGATHDWTLEQTFRITAADPFLRYRFNLESNLLYKGTTSSPSVGGAFDFLNTASLFIDADGLTYRSDTGLVGPPEANAVPEPGTYALLGLAALGYGIYRRRRNAS
jgi:hypothetical protein